MKVIDWLLKGDSVINRLTRKYLLDEVVPYVNDGFIKKYLDLFDHNNNRFGNCIYSPKWISTHYTLLELKNMEIDPSNEIYQKAAKNLLDSMWKNNNIDVCIGAMIISICTYGNIKDKKIEEIIDFLLLHRFSDGGWNCSWYQSKRPTKSSLHTTLSVLEAFYNYQTNGYTYRLQEIKALIPEAEEFILKKKLFRSVTTNEIINPSFTKFHYPTRWKYDAFRALEYFQVTKHLYDDRMEEAFAIIDQQFKKGYIGIGSTYSGLNYFKLESNRAGRFNTLRALKILKFYQPNKYNDYLNKDIKNLN